MGSKSVFFTANRSRGLFPITPRQTFFCIFSDAFVGPPFSSQRDPKGLPKGAHKIAKNRKQYIEKAGRNFKPRNGAWKKEVPSVKIVLPSKFGLLFQGPQAFQEACQMESQMESQIHKSKKTCEKLAINKT